jgi:hypothetical protein
VTGGWLLDGQKRWIGNGTWADVVVVFARSSVDNKVRAVPRVRWAAVTGCSRAALRAGAHAGCRPSCVLRRCRDCCRPRPPRRRR